jgi:hypothetical protein
MAGKSIESRIGLKENESCIALFVSPFEPLQRPLVVAYWR